MEKVRFGIIGLGNQGTSYTWLFDNGQIENGVISALCDIDGAKIDAMKEKRKAENGAACSEVTYFEDYREMLDSGLCDAVLVETPHYFHPEMAIECLKRDINVVVEKPAGVYTKQVREMNEAASRSKALFGMMFNQRTDCLYRKMREIIAGGGIGSLQRVTWIITDWYRTQSYYDSGSWRATWDGEGGGVLFNQCPHQLDLVQWVVGASPVSVRGFLEYGKWHDVEVEDEATAFFTYANGATGMFITTTGEAPGSNRFEVSGTLGKLVCERGELTWYKNDTDSAEFSKTSENGFARPKVEIENVETDKNNPQHKGIINNFANAILGIEPLFVPGTDGIAGVELMNAIELSGWLGGKEVSLPVDEELYLTELNKRRATSRFKSRTK